MKQPEGRPDAVIYPESFKSGRRASDRYKSLVIAAEELLQVDRAAGEHARYWKMPHLGGKCFATRSLEDSFLFPTGHPLAGQPRYDWFPSPDHPEVQFGYYVPEVGEKWGEENA